MKNPSKPCIIAFVGKFLVLHLVSFALIAVVFLLFKSNLPESKRIALNYYEPFRLFDMLSVTGQALRGLAFAFIIYPFYDLVFKNKKGRLLLFLSIWGLALICSVEPQPGSIEGVIYTTITFTEHVAVILFVAMQAILFVWLIFKWEAHQPQFPTHKIANTLFPEKHKLKSYTIRFTIMHLLTYWIVGSIFYQMANYNDALETMEVFELWRPLENLPAVFLVFGGQIVRGVLLAVGLYPFYNHYIYKKYGWALLYLLLAGLTILGSPIFIREFIAFQGNTTEFLESLIIGIPEIFSQMLIFSLLFFFWQKKASVKK